MNLAAYHDYKTVKISSEMLLLNLTIYTPSNRGL